MKRKYRSILIIFSIHSERIHRHVLDEYYQQDHVISKIECLIVWYHKLLFRIFPEYRQYLKYYKQILSRGYKQSRLNLTNYIINSLLKKINTIRYSDYFN